MVGAGLGGENTGREGRSGGSGGPDSVVGDETLIGEPDGGRMSKSANSS